MKPQAGQDLGNAFFDSGNARFRLFGLGEVQDVPAFSAWCEAFKGLFEMGVCIQKNLKFFGNGFWLFFELDFEAGFFDSDSFFYKGPDHGFLLIYLKQARKF